MKICFFLFLLIVPVILPGCGSEKPDKGVILSEFYNPPKATHLHVWWHWIDGAITKEGITRDLEAMNKHGIVQVTILDVSMFEGADFGVQQVKVGSTQWYNMFRWALEEADRLGITIGIHNCPGWSTSGGPWISPEQSMKQYTWSKQIVDGGRKVIIQLKEPFSSMGFYKDVAVVAFKSEGLNSFHKSIPEIYLNDKKVNRVLMDGSPLSGLPFHRGDVLDINFKKKFNPGKILLHLRKLYSHQDMGMYKAGLKLLCSNNGINYKECKDFEVSQFNESISVAIPKVNAKWFRIEFISSSADFSIGELELLKQKERAFFDPEISSLMGKTVSVKVAEGGEEFYREGSDCNINNCIPVDGVINISDKLSENGLLQWEAPEGNWTVIRFGYTTTGMTNSPASSEGTGLECDKMDTLALNHHFESFPQKLADIAGDYSGNTFRFLLLDSFGWGHLQNWTSLMQQEFENRRGYGLISWIPVLCGETVGDVSLSNAFLYDFRRTIADLIEQNYFKHFSDLCHRENLEIHAEIPYGETKYPPLDVLKANEYVDLPMFEFWKSYGRRKDLNSYFPVSRPDIDPPAHSVVFSPHFSVAAAESYTGFSYYSESLADLKPYGDRAFCAGINQMILHSYVLQPFEKKPGMTLGPFGMPFNRHNLWWNYISEWNDYHARIQYVLQNTSTVSDILYFVGDQFPQFMNNSTVERLPFGYSSAACNFDLLKNKTKVKDGGIIVSGELTYSLLVLPDHPVMSYETIKCIEGLVKKGAIVYGQKPVKMLSLTDQLNNVEEFFELSDLLWGKDVGSVTEHSYGKGKIIWNKDIEEVLDDLKLSPDFKTNINDSLKTLYIHKTNGREDIYFVFNQTEDTLFADCKFRTGRRDPEIWNPMNGTTKKPAIYTINEDYVSIPVRFYPHESFIFLFKGGAARDHITEVEFEGRQVYPPKENVEDIKDVPFASMVDGVCHFVSEQSGDYQFKTNKGKIINTELSSPEIFELHDFKGTIEFHPGYDEKISSININRPGWWTDSEDMYIKYFAGKARYVINFNVPDNFVVKEDSVLLNIGNFSSGVTITLNDQLVGKAWMPNVNFNVSQMLKEKNKLVIEVTNCYRNRIIGDLIEYGKVQSVWTSAPVGKYLNINSSVTPSGIAGPIQVIRIKKTGIRI